MNTFLEEVMIKFRNAFLKQTIIQ